jgi:hypothetical protein
VDTRRAEEQEAAMALFERRRAPRELAGLHGVYLLAVRSDLGWHDCYLLDVSEFGAGARFRGPSPEVGDDVLICVDGPEGPASIRLHATVRHVRADYFGATRAGIEFAPLGPEHRESLLRLLRGERV